MDILSEAGNDQPKGSITFTGDRSIVQLFEGSEASTLLHEMGGHFGMRVMHDLAGIA